MSGVTPQKENLETKPDPQGRTTGYQGKKWISKLIVLTLIALAIITSIIFIAPAVKENGQNRRMERALAQGTDYLSAGQFGLALDEFEKVLKADSANVTAQLSLGWAHLHLLNYPKAEEAAQELLARDPDCLEGHELLCNVKIATEDIAGALQCISNARQLLGGNALEDLLTELDAHITLEPDGCECFENEWFNVWLRYFSGGKVLDLTPEWNAEPGQLIKLPDGRANITSGPGEVKVTARLGPLVREITVTFIPEIPLTPIPESYYTIRGKESAVEFVVNANTTDVMPCFTDSENLSDLELLEIATNWLHIHCYTHQHENIRYKYTPAEIEPAVWGILGLAPKALQNQHQTYFEWDPVKGVYERSTEGTDWETRILSTATKGSLYIVEATHFFFDSDSLVTEYLDEDINIFLIREWGEDEVQTLDVVRNIEEQVLLRLPRRRYVFQLQADGSYILKEVSRLD